MQGGVWGGWSYGVFPGVWGHSGPVRANLKDASPPQSDKSPLNVDSLVKLCVSDFRWLLGYGYNFIFNARPARSEQMEGAYQRCSADVQALGRQQVPQSMYDPVTNQ